jgi:hypothetical protein
MPYKSRAQAAYFNIHKKELSKQGVDVNEWNEASRGLRLPKKIKSYESGGTVTETGPALLHKNEIVIPAEKNMEGSALHELMASRLGSGQPKKKKAKLHMHIYQMDDKKFHVEHSYRGGEEPSPEGSEHAPANLKELHAHLDSNYGPDDSTESVPPTPENA